MSLTYRKDTIEIKIWTFLGKGSKSKAQVTVSDDDLSPLVVIPEHSLVLSQISDGIKCDLRVVSLLLCLDNLDGVRVNNLLHDSAVILLCFVSISNLKFHATQYLTSLIRTVDAVAYSSGIVSLLELLFSCFN